MRTDTTLTLTLVGEVDERERDEIIAALDGGDPPVAVRFEVAELRYIGSSGLAALLHAWHLVAPAGGHVELIDPTRPLLRLLEVCGLTDHFLLRTTDRGS